MAKRKTKGTDPDLYGEKPKPAEAPKTESAPAASTPAPTPAPAAKKGTRLKLSSLRKGVTAVAKRPVISSLAGLAAAAAIAKAVRRPDDRSDLEEAVGVAMRRAKGEQVARLLEQSRMERAITQNQARLAQANPTLYTSVMAGRKVPTGAVVLGGRPRTDLMRELAASMDSGAFQKKDPLSELLMG